MQEFNFKSYKFLAIILLICTFISLPTFISAASFAETNFYPVVEEFKINSEIPTVLGHTIIAGEFSKERNCPSRDITWFMKDPVTGEDIPVPINKIVVPKNRPPGEYKFGPWEIWAKKEDLEERGFAVMLHECHPFYLTRSIVYAKGIFR